MDRHGLLALAMTTHSLSLRGKNGAREAAIHCMQWSRTENAVRFPTHSRSPRAFRPRDDRGEKGENKRSLLLSVFTLGFFHQVAFHILMNKSGNERLIGNSFLSRFSLDTDQVMAT